MTQNIDMNKLGQQAQQASYELAQASTAQKNTLLELIAQGLREQQPQILAANAIDILGAQQAGLDESLIDRLLLNSERLNAMADDVQRLCQLDDPVGEETESKLLESGLRLSKRRVPIGVLGVIYEARPNVTIDIAALALKTGNAAILRGGKETINSNLALLNIISQALVSAELPTQSIQYIENTDRALVSQLLTLDRYVDMIVPRGGAGLHRLCIDQSTIPVITGGIGICHLYVEGSANVAKSVDIIENAKVQRPSVCNALDVVLVDKSVANSFLPQLVERLNNSNVALKADESALAILRDCHLDGVTVDAADKGDFDQEWLSLTLSIKVVDDITQAVSHIRAHSSQHSDGILTESLSKAEQFVNQVNSAAVYVNASTRFTDGSQFGLGAEVAVSTQKLHARGPMGLKELTTYKWIGVGDYLARK
ncbi:glutamate-5-semialdehyde dehydrogenase [Psychrobium sp. 1_MG-2023]|uniref:glutamate-5-semialdehyde dehydrogenase n=1 Tax=Psychrobium sp. 1_MG-2023 TaxID=3062624 RepID=UPI000C349349|nr:glutamate-5-semialdehyde dehydrogenase [Psychrobium sp. 1_MG-2023]MDP2561347.1 glutamate-5-semialdehyde dehydrogenase [Psychrobium sp. 1_MG-2023]PKF54160.1 glutamate-5-semialdehyde dehydrogenase [Alteromonadales bacterium alter-6D02]